MKTVSSKLTLTALLVGAALTSVQADESRWVWPEDRPQQLMLAEDGSDRLLDFREQRQAIGNRPTGEESGDDLVRMIKEQPTAAGPGDEQATEMKMDKPKPMYKSPIQRDRDLYGK